MSIQAVIDQLKERGFKVYGPQKLSTYVYFTPDGVRIGYVQYSNLRGITYTTVHKPDKDIGTGFSADSAEDALKSFPDWAVGKGFCNPVKYADMEAFIKQNWQTLVQY